MPVINAFRPAAANASLAFSVSRARLLTFFMVSMLSTVGAAAAPATTAPTTAPTLLAHGSSDTFWYALVRTDSSGDSLTQAWVRPLQSGQWQPLPEIPGRAIQLADYQGELLVVLDDGQWKRISPSQFASGPPLPTRGPTLAMTAGGDGIFALVIGPRPELKASTAAVTAPGTRATTAALTTIRPTPAIHLAASTQSATVPATQADRIQLYQLGGTGWIWRNELPRELQGIRPPRLSMTAVGGELLLGSVNQSGDVLIHRYDSAGHNWVETAHINASKPTAIKLIPIRDRVLLWIRSGNGAGALSFRPQPGAWSPAKPVDLPAGAQFTAVTVAAAGDEVRVLTLGANEKLSEQKYGAAGDLTQPLTEMASTRVPVERPGIMQLVLLLALGCFILTNLAKRKPTQVVEINKVRIALAPLAPRLVAGLIDATPIIIGLIWAARYSPTASGWQQLLAAGWMRWLVLGSWAIYVLHTMVAELIWQRSFGKMFVGLRVVGFDGKPAAARAIVIRNLLRLIDVVLFGFSLTAVFFTPLRQRLGDMPSGTLVIGEMPKESDKKKLKESEED